MNGKFLSCDWGSSSLRVRIYDTQNEKIIASHKGDHGILKTHANWQSDGGENRLEFYQRQLQEYIGILQSGVNEDLSGLPLVISGMASASIGMMALPYASLPFALDGRGLEIARFSKSASINNDSMLISGVSSDDDVMRGEETELVGFAAGLTEKDGLFIFPGTHSKHLIVKDGQAARFDTFMTGEIFALLSEHSILKSAIHNSEYPAREGFAAFDEGVLRSVNSNLLNQFFKVRAHELFATQTATDNYFFLSGMLIGYELSAVRWHETPSIFLCAGGKIADLYKRAIDLLGHADKTRTFSTETAETAVAIGQYMIFQNNT